MDDTISCALSSSIPNYANITGICIFFSGYKIRYRHSSEPKNIHADIWSLHSTQRLMTSLELTEAASRLHITYMRIDGDIPPALNTITPNLMYLKLENIPHIDQLEQ